MSSCLLSPSTAVVAHWRVAPRAHLGDLLDHLVDGVLQDPQGHRPRPGEGVLDTATSPHPPHLEDRQVVESGQGGELGVDLAVLPEAALHHRGVPVDQRLYLQLCFSLIHLLLETL